MSQIEKQEALDKIRKAYFEEKKLIPFIGSGFSSNIRGFPLWDDFVKVLQKDLVTQDSIVDAAKINNVKNCQLSLMFGTNFMEATEYYYWCQSLIAEGHDICNLQLAGKNRFRELLISEFNKVELRPTCKADKRYIQHFIIAEKFDKVYTTNWDKTLYHAARKMGKKPRKIYSGITAETINQISQIENDANFLIYYYHGCYEDPTSESIVASESDYYSRLRNLNKNPLDIHLMKDMLENTFIFLGYSLHDINVSYFINQINQVRVNKVTGDNKKNYILLMESPEELNYSKYYFYDIHKDLIHVPLLTRDDKNSLCKKYNDTIKEIFNTYKINKVNGLDINELTDKTGAIKPGLVNQEYVNQKLDQQTTERKNEVFEALERINDEHSNIKRELYQIKTVEFLKQLN